MRVVMVMEFYVNILHSYFVYYLICIKFMLSASCIIISLPLLLGIGVTQMKLFVVHHMFIHNFN